MKKSTTIIARLICSAVFLDPLTASCDTGKTFSFTNSDRNNIGPLKMYVESSHCIADGDLIPFGTIEAPKQLGSKESVSNLVSRSSGLETGCTGDEEARFSVRFFENAPHQTEGADNGYPLRTTSVTFSLDKWKISDIDNQGSGGFSIINPHSSLQPNNHLNYLIDWQGLGVARHDVVLNAKGRPEVELRCVSRGNKKRCKGNVLISSSDIPSNTSNPHKQVIIAKGAYNLRSNETKAVPLRLTKASNNPQISDTPVDVRISAIPFGQAKTTLASANFIKNRGMQYQLRVLNNSASLLTPCLFQKSADYNIASVAWMVTTLAPSQDGYFSWTNNDYSFVWGYGQPFPGIIFGPVQTVNAALGQQITFDGQQFTNQTTGPQPDSLFINSGIAVQMGQLIGIGMSGNPVFVTSAAPNSTARFSPGAMFIADCGGYRQGSIINGDVLSRSGAEINPASWFSATVTYNMDGTWHVTYP